MFFYGGFFIFRDIICKGGLTAGLSPFCLIAVIYSFARAADLKKDKIILIFVNIFVIILQNINLDKQFYILHLKFILIRYIINYSIPTKI